ncbi:hypothetical protein ACFW15_29110, partial [Streptomyces sp. NPDC058953]
VRLLAAEGTTIVLTTHYLDEVEALADRIAVIARGRVVAEGGTEELRRAHGRRTRVSWTEPGGVERTEWTTTPTRTVAALAARYGDDVPGLRIVRPTLEEIYLRLTGEAAADPAADTGDEAGQDGPAEGGRR